MSRQQVIGWALIALSAGVFLGAAGLPLWLTMLIVLPSAAAAEGIRRWRTRKPRRVGPRREWIN